MSQRSTLLLEHHLKELRLPSFLREYQKMAAQCAPDNVDHPEYLLQLAEQELIDRHQRMVERRIRAARFQEVKSLDTFDFPAIPSVNKALVMELARCEYVQRRENVIAVGNSGTGKTHVALGPSASSGGTGSLSAGHVRGFHHRRRAGARTHGGQGREAAAQPAAATGPAQPADHRRAGLRTTVQNRRRIALRGIQPALRAGLYPGDHQPPLRRMYRGILLGASHRSPAGSAHPPRAYHRDEWRELLAKAQPGRALGSRLQKNRTTHKSHQRPSSFTRPACCQPVSGTLLPNN